MTTDMPVFGDATYNGNWVAAVRAAHPDGEGGISQSTGLVEMDAHFSRNTVDITLHDLASLSGKISGNTFSGSANAVLLDADALNTGMQPQGGMSALGTFTGSVNGAFFGSQGKEVGGVFDYDSLNSRHGAFRGAFGGARNPDPAED